eukprot:6783557-Prymnesium_polylepis.1
MAQPLRTVNRRRHPRRDQGSPLLANNYDASRWFGAVRSPSTAVADSVQAVRASFESADTLPGARER